jgi:hypothetical protein
MLMRTLSLVLVAASFLVCGVAFGGEAEGANAVTVTIEPFVNAKGDGPDGKGNTADDTWGFWFQLAHNRNQYGRLKRHTTSFTPQQRKKGIRGRVTGPIGGWMPNKDACEGWIYHRDWDGRFEGAWADTKTKQAYLYPYVEKGAHCAVAMTYKIPKTGTYTITGTVSDAQVHPQFKQHDGVVFEISEVGPDNKGKGQVLLKTKPFGDKKNGQPDSREIKIENVKLTEGKLLRFAVHPRRWWGSDRTRVDGIKIERVEN